MSTGERIGFTLSLTQPTPRAIASREIGDRTYYNSLRALLKRTHTDYDLSYDYFTGNLNRFLGSSNLQP